MPLMVICVEIFMYMGRDDLESSKSTLMSPQTPSEKFKFKQGSDGDPYFNIKENVVASEQWKSEMKIKVSVIL